MTGLTERLDALAREATGAVELLPPELAARARRRHRIQLRVGGIALAACAAGASLYAAVSSSGSQKVQVATPPGVTSATTATPSPSGVWADLASIARRQATQFGDPSPLSAHAVATDLAAFQQATSTSASSPAFNPRVYFIEITGQFTCTVCLGPGPGFPKGTVLGLAIERATMTVVGTSLGNQAANLAALGPVHRLDLAAASTGPPAPTTVAVVDVPNIAGTSEAAAGAVLAHLGLVAIFTTQSSSTVPQGVVIAVAPSPGSRVAAGSAVSVTISSGPNAPITG